MTDPMELVRRLESNSKQAITRYCGDLDGAIVPHDLLTEAAACIRELVERQLPAISKDGPNEIGRHGRFWLARQLLDSNLTDAEAYGIVAHHPAITAVLPPAPGAEA